jgi:hypothetical protein
MRAIKLNIAKALLVFSLFFGFSANAQKTNVKLSQLPATAQNFIRSNFAGQVIEHAIEDKEILGTDYEVRFANGTEIDFDKNGNWEEIDGHNVAVPASAIPTSITTYINKHYKGHHVTQIDKNSSNYAVEINNGLELVFDAKGNFTRIDD